MDMELSQPIDETGELPDKEHISETTHVTSIPDIVSTRHLYVPMRDLVVIVLITVSVMGAWGLYSAKIDDLSTKLTAYRTQQEIQGKEISALDSRLNNDELKIQSLEIENQILLMHRK